MKVLTQENGWVDVREIMDELKEISREEARQILDCRNETITSYINEGRLTPTEKSTPKKQFFLLSEVKKINKGARKPETKTKNAA